MPLFITEEASYRSPVLPPVVAPEVLRVFISVVLGRIVLVILRRLGCNHGLWWRSSSLRPLRRRQRGWWRLCTSYCGGWLGWPRQLFVGQLWFERLVFHAPLLDLSSRSEFWRFMVSSVLSARGRLFLEDLLDPSGISHHSFHLIVAQFSDFSR